MKRHTILSLSIIFWFNIHSWVWMLTCALPRPVCCVSTPRSPLLCCAALPVPVCLCSCVLWLQFTQIWPCCRQVSLLREVLQRDPGRQCHPGRRPSAAADVCIFCRPESFEVLLLLNRTNISKQWTVRVERCDVECILRLSAAWYQRSSLRRRKMTCWTLSRKSRHF